MNQHRPWMNRVRHHLRLAVTAVMDAGTTQGYVSSAAPGLVWQSGGLDVVMHRIWTPRR